MYEAKEEKKTKCDESAGCRAIIPLDCREKCHVLLWSLSLFSDSPCCQCSGVGSSERLFLVIKKVRGAAVRAAGQWSMYIINKKANTSLFCFSVHFKALT